VAPDVPAVVQAESVNISAVNTTVAWPLTVETSFKKTMRSFSTMMFFEILWVSLNKFKSWKLCLCDACNQMVEDHGSLVGVIHHSVRFTVRNLEQKRKHKSFQQSESSQPVQWVLYQVVFFCLLYLGTQVWCSLQLKHLDFLPAYIRTVSRHTQHNKSDGSIAWQNSDPRF